MYERYDQFLKAAHALKYGGESGNWNNKIVMDFINVSGIPEADLIVEKFEIQILHRLFALVLAVNVTTSLF